MTCQRRSYSTFLTLMVWLLTAPDLLLLDSGEEEEGMQGRKSSRAGRWGKR